MLEAAGTAGTEHDRRFGSERFRLEEEALVKTFIRRLLSLVIVLVLSADVLRAQGHGEHGGQQGPPPEGSPPSASESGGAGGEKALAPSGAAPSGAAPQAAEAHGGAVTMTGDHHFEVAFQRDKVQVWLYDANQTPLDARGVAARVEVRFEGARSRRAVTTELMYVAGADGAPGHIEGPVDMAQVPEGAAWAAFQLLKLPGVERQVSFRDTFRLARLIEGGAKFIYACPTHRKVTSRNVSDTCWECGRPLERKEDGRGEGHEHPDGESASSSPESGGAATGSTGESGGHPAGHGGGSGGEQESPGSKSQAGDAGGEQESPGSKGHGGDAGGEQESRGSKGHGGDAGGEQGHGGAQESPGSKGQGGNSGGEQESPGSKGHEDGKGSTGSKGHEDSEGSDERKPGQGGGIMQTVMPGLATSPNIHPVFVHYPIALWTLAALALALGLMRRNEQLVTTSRWLVHLAFASSVLTAMTGLMAESALGHDSPNHELVHTHRKFMLVTTALGGLASLAVHLTRTRTDRKARLLAGGVLLATLMVMTLGADRGAVLVYGHGIGTRKPAPESGRSKGVSAPGQSKGEEGGESSGAANHPH